MKDCISQWRDLMSANFASVNWSVMNPMMRCYLLANWAVDSAWINMILKPFKAGIVIGKHLVKVFFSEFRLLGFHIASPHLHLYYTIGVG
jgi:hypothetical protein